MRKINFLPDFHLEPVWAVAAASPGAVKILPELCDCKPLVMVVNYKWILNMYVLVVCLPQPYWRSIVSSELVCLGSTIMDQFPQ